MANNHRSYVARTLTLTLANHNYNLLELMQALVPTCPGSAREFNIQADVNNSSSNFLQIGDESMDGTHYGFFLPPGAVRTYRADHQVVLVGNIYLRCASAGALVHVEVMV